jgi:hypothetical protein
LPFIRITLAKPSAEYTPVDGFVRTAQTARQMRHRFFRRATKSKTDAPISTDSGEPSRPSEFRADIRHKLFMAAFVVILASAMLGWFFLLTWAFAKIIGFF